MLSDDQEYVDISTIGIDQVAQTPAPLPSSSEKATVSYWLATTAAHQLPDSLDTLPTESDTVIIGSGITGVSTAYHLVTSAPSSNSPISSITIVEARDFCSGATGRNGGHLSEASALAYTEIAANPNHLLGTRASGLSADDIKVESAKVVEQILKFEKRTADAIRSLIAEEKVEEEIGFTDDRNWHLCFEHAEVDAFEKSLAQAAQHDGLRKFVEQVRRVPKEEVNRRMDKPVGIVGVYEIPGATLHPRALVSVIYRRAERIARDKGISLNVITHSPVVGITSSSPELTTLTTVKGDINAKFVVHATNGYTSHLLPHLSSSDNGIIPTRAQVVAVAPTQRKHLWGMALSAGGGYEYGHQRPTSESSSLSGAPGAPLYIFGGGREYADGREWGVADDTSLNSQVSSFLHTYLSNTFPRSYSGEEVQMEWTGVMGYTKSKDPLVGPVWKVQEGARKGREYLAAGYSGHGMTRAFGCAQVVADMVWADSNRVAWRKKEDFPTCYLTAGAKEEGMWLKEWSADKVQEGEGKGSNVGNDSFQARPASGSTSAINCCNVV
ncbi:hypothetical protein EX895_005882 [Sporisorium graminicola]|uniref:FAD dependent oxidoreductase domain-containing protein n=1 Tax=Sporisorium graminicola TaxID=280036 RepID=A0A4U7KPA8_9BASI|nr:hypothetical protein EX895_005882 [Sporisorium graminicola]TKY84802.1 hypothetical protein EX895_005882 [Sporisorium graminicola]